MKTRLILVGLLAAMFAQPALAEGDKKETKETKDTTGRSMMSPRLYEGSGGGGGGPSISSYSGPIGSGVSGEFEKHSPACGSNAAGFKPGVYVRVDGKDYFLRCK